MRREVITALFVALAAALRLAKHVILGPIQFLNIPAVFTIIGGLMFGYSAGATIGILSFVVSDLLLGYAGIWTVYTSLSMGLIGILSPLIKRVNANSSYIGLGVCSYLLILTYDILSSVSSLILLVPIQTAVIWSILGLFLPSPVLLYPVGLLTEVVTVTFIVLTYPRIEKALAEVKT